MEVGGEGVAEEELEDDEEEEVDEDVVEGVEEVDDVLVGDGLLTTVGGDGSIVGTGLPVDHGSGQRSEMKRM